MSDVNTWRCLYARQTLVVDIGKQFYHGEPLTYFARSTASVLEQIECAFESSSFGLQQGEARRQ